MAMILIFYSLKEWNLHFWPFLRGQNFNLRENCQNSAYEKGTWVRDGAMAHAQKKENRKVA